MSDKIKFKMFPFNEIGGEVEHEGLKIETDLGYDLFYYITNNIEMLIDEMTGMVVWGQHTDDLTMDDTKIKQMKTIIKKKLIHDSIRDLHNSCIKQGILLPSCTKKIAVLFPKQDIILKTTATNKNFNELINKFELDYYFKHFLISKNFGGQTVSMNSVLINPKDYVLPVGRNEIVVDMSKENLLSLGDVPSAHSLIFPELTRRGICDVIVTFKISKYVIAKYNPETNVLILSNITTIKDFDWLNKFFIYLKKEYLERTFKPSSKAFEVTIGCDPEFELYDSKNKLMTGNDLNAEGRLQKKIGADGHGKQLELRPEASTEVKNVVDDLVKLFGAVSNLRVCVKGDHEPLGGHIHFGVLSKDFTGTLGFSETIKELLDTFIGKKTIPMNGKARSQYGSLGDIRTQPWGFEYRTPPASIFATKEIAYITMKLAKNLMEEIMTRDIEIELPISEKDYYKFLTVEEARFFFDFDKIYKTLDTNDIVKYWTDKKNKPIEIKFYDAWNEDIKKYYIENLKDTIIDFDTTLCLYGVKGNRCAGLESCGQSIPHPKGVHCSEGIAIGLPKTYRTDSPDIRVIVSDIKKKIGMINGTMCKRTTEILFPEELIGCNHNIELSDTEPIENFDQPVEWANEQIDAFTTRVR